MKEALTFDDVLIVPKFSTVSSRKDVDLSFNGIGYPYIGLPIISANMDTITGPEMAKAMLLNGAQACLHRFCSIEDSVKMFRESCLYATGEGTKAPFVSIGLGNNELDRARALFDAGAYSFVIDVANGASMDVVKQVKALHGTIGDNGAIIVGNFASVDGVLEFLLECGTFVDGLKIGIGPGSSCTTRIKTGIGYPQLSAIMEISNAIRETKIPVIADGGLKTPGDCAKALAAGASMLMSGSFFAGTDETPGDLVNSVGRKLEFLSDGMVQVDEWVSHPSNVRVFKKYRGSASKESYEAQGKDASWRTAEGESFLVPYKGPVKDVLADIEGGLRSAFSYVGAKTLKDFQEKAEFVRVTNAGYIEGTPHGKK